MCTIAVLLDVVAGAPLVLAANRDELYARPTRTPELLSPRGGPRIVGGVDELSGGTWLAVRSDGRFAAVTNQRQLAPQPPGLRSRGLAVKELAVADDQEAYVAALDPTQYASMNLMWGDAHGVAVAYLNRAVKRIEIERLDRGVHVLCNNRLRSQGFPRGERLAELIVRMPMRWPEVAAPLARALADHARVPESETPVDSVLPFEIAHAMTSICIHTEAYGTRSATIVAAEPGRLVDYRYTAGRPCEHPFVDGMHFYA